MQEDALSRLHTLRETFTPMDKDVTFFTDD